MRAMAFIDAGQFRVGILKEKFGITDEDNMRFNWEHFSNFLKTDVAKDGLIDVHYFDAIIEQQGTPKQNFHGFLTKRLGFQLHFTPIKSKSRCCPKCRHSWDEYEQKGVDATMSVYISRLAENNAFDKLILCTGDGDFAPLVSYLRDVKGKPTTVVSFDSGLNAGLRDIATEVICLEQHRDKFIKPIKSNEEE